MALGTYGIVRPADVSPEDVEIILHYTESRDTTNNFTLKKLNTANILTPYFHNSNTGGNADVEILGGLYNLKLTADNFSELGIYTLHIRPKQIRTTITDCGILASLPSVRGIVIDLSNVPSADRNKFSPQGLVGYRIEYISTIDNTKLANFYVNNTEKQKTLSIFTETFYNQEARNSSKQPIGKNNFVMILESDLFTFADIYEFLKLQTEFENSIDIL